MSPLAFGRWLGVIALLAACLPCSLRAEPPQTASAPASVRVVGVDSELRLRKIIQVRVQGLDSWTRTTAAPAWRLVPYLDGRALEGLYPIAVDVHAGTLQYYLADRAESRAVWAHLLSPLAFERVVRFSVGLEQQDPLPSDFASADGRVRLVVVERGWSLIAAAVVLLLAFSFVRLAVKTPLLMDAFTDGTGCLQLRFSLAKFQFALWFFVILSAFLVIWLTTGEFNSLNASVVGVLGISACTAVGDGLLQRTPGQRPLTPGYLASRPMAWRIFWNDLVSDEKGHSLARFQMLAWTAILIVVFLVDVFDDLRMPVLGPELLYLLGLSSGTFVAQRPGEATGTAAGSEPTGKPISLASPVDRPLG